jgi:hypothetical protein
MKKKIIIIAAIFLFLLVFYLYLNFSSQKPNKETVPSPTPTAVLGPEEGKGDPDFLDYLQKGAAEKFPLINAMPHAEATWSIDYLGPLHLEVIVKDKNVEKVKEEVLAWIKNQEVDPTTHQIDWVNKF